MTTKKKLLKKKLREKRIKKEKRLRKVIVKRTLDKVGKQMTPEQQGGFMMTLYKIWRDFMLFIGEIKCTFGIHDWRLCSGRPGQPKYSCIRCWAKSSKLWEGTGSKEHYAQKEANKRLRETVVDEYLVSKKRIDKKIGMVDNRKKLYETKNKKK